MCIYINIYIYCKRLVLLITCNFVNGNVAWLLSCSADFAAEILIMCECNGGLEKSLWLEYMTLSLSF